MTLSGLYYICDNLGPSSCIKIWQGKGYLGEFTYKTISYELEQAQVKGFKVVNDTDIEVHI